MDDYNTIVWNFSYTFGDEPLTERERTQEGTGNAFDIEVDRHTFRSFQTAENHYLIDRREQKTKTYSGIKGTNTQDRAVQEGMGRIADRTLERLGTADRAIITARRNLLRAVEAMQRGEEPAGVAPTYYKLRSIEKVLPKGSNWLEAMGPYIFQLEEPLTAASV
jgi:phthalate 4,5-dioxygenase